MGMAAEPLVIDDCGAQLNRGRAALSGLWSCRVWAADETDFLWRSLIELVLKQARVPLSPAKTALYFYSGFSFFFFFLQCIEGLKMAKGSPLTDNTSSRNFVFQ